MTTMRRAMVVGPGRIEIREAEVPDIGDTTVLVDIEYVGICGSDVHYFQSGRNGSYEIREPLALGHEAVGTVRATGTAVARDLDVGTAVAVHPAFPAPAPGDPAARRLNLFRGGSYLGSASTLPHTQGAFSEVVAVDATQIRRLPDGLPARRAALAEPLSIAIHGVDRVAGSVAGARVLVSGAGPIGCLVTAVLRHRGAAAITVIDFHDRALDIATACGADTTVNLATQEPPATESFDVVIEAAGAVASLAKALEYVTRGGAIVQLGILPPGALSIELAALVSKEITVYGSQRFDVEMDEALEILAAHPEFDAVITDDYSLDEVETALGAAADAATSTKVLLRVNAAPTAARTNQNKETTPHEDR